MILLRLAPRPRGRSAVIAIRCAVAGGRPGNWAPAGFGGGRIRKCPEKPHGPAMRYPWQKIVLDRQLTDRGVKLLDLTRRRSAWSSTGFFQAKIGFVNLVALREVVHCRQFAHRLKRDLRHQPSVQSSVVSSSCSAPFKAIRSRRPPTKPVVLKSGATSCYRQLERKFGGGYCSSGPATTGGQATSQFCAV